MNKQLVALLAIVMIVVSSIAAVKAEPAMTLAENVDYDAAPLQPTSIFKQLFAFISTADDGAVTNTFVSPTPAGSPKYDSYGDRCAVGERVELLICDLSGSTEGNACQRLFRDLWEKTYVGDNLPINTACDLDEYGNVLPDPSCWTKTWFTNAVSDKYFGYNCHAAPATACVDGNWTPRASTVCTGEIVTQTNNCGDTRTVPGAKQCAPTTPPPTTPPPTTTNDSDNVQATTPDYVNDVKITGIAVDRTTWNHGETVLLSLKIKNSGGLDHNYEGVGYEVMVIPRSTYNVLAQKWGFSGTQLQSVFSRPMSVEDRESCARQRNPSCKADGTCEYFVTGGSFNIPANVEDYLVVKDTTKLDAAATWLYNAAFLGLGANASLTKTIPVTIPGTGAHFAQDNIAAVDGSTDYVILAYLYDECYGSAPETNSWSFVSKSLTVNGDAAATPGSIAPGQRVKLQCPEGYFGTDTFAVLDSQITPACYPLKAGLPASAVSRYQIQQLSINQYLADKDTPLCLGSQMCEPDANCVFGSDKDSATQTQKDVYSAVRNYYTSNKPVQSNTWWGLGGCAAGAAGGVKGGAVIGTAVAPGPGSVVGGAIGGVVGCAAGTVVSFAARDVITDIRAENNLEVGLCVVEAKPFSWNSYVDWYKETFGVDQGMATILAIALPFLVLFLVFKLTESKPRGGGY